MSIKLTIERGVPMPTRKAVQRMCQLPLDQLKPTESIFVPETIMGNKYVISEVSFHRTTTAAEFTCRSTCKDGVPGVRIWRVR